MVTTATETRNDAVRLLREQFFNRTDRVAVLAPWGKPCPVEANGNLDALLLGHILGDQAPETKVRYEIRRGTGAMMGRFRVGSYCPAPDATTRWLCIDLDGAGHAGALVDPQAAALESLSAFHREGLPAYLERSGGGKGWHLWCFFDPALPASKAQALGRALAPKNARLDDGSIADPRSGRGIEVFPKQAKIRSQGYGNLVWLPWWCGAAGGGNQFYRQGEAGELEPFTPDGFKAAKLEDADRILGALREQPKVAPAPPEHPTTTIIEGAWADWRRRAVTALPLEAVYGSWLTGNAAGTGWLECRDPGSASGDQNPSAGVADGSGDAERGAFHSFISGETMSVFDFLVQHGSAADFRDARGHVAALSGIPEPTAPEESKQDPPRVSQARKPRIVIRTAECEVVDEAIDALARIPGVYNRGQLLVHVVRDASKLAGIIHPGGSARIVPLGPAGVRDRLTAAAEWISLREREGEVEEVPAHPPAWASPAVEARKSWPRMRYLEGIVEQPVLRHDGSVLEQTGYDETTGLLYVPNATYPAIPRQPSKDDAVAAANEILDVVCDFPFKTDAHRAAWLAGVLTPLARYAFRGPAPLFLMDANVRSAGKTLLADVTGEILCGRAMPRTPQATDETEEIKRITAIVLEGDRVVLIDNLTRPLGSGALDTVLTGTVWSDRILGKSEKVCLPLLTVWYASGNNITFKGDTARRCLHIRLDSDHERPEYRDGFKHPKLLEWTHEHRVQLVVAALTILRAYTWAGRPDVGLKPWGSFEDWSALVRNAIVWTGLADPGATRAELDQVDGDSTALADLVAGWQELLGDRATVGCTVAQAIETLRADPDRSRYGRLHAAMDELCPHPVGQLPSARKLGNALRRLRGRVVGDRKLETRVLKGMNLWLVREVGAPIVEQETNLDLQLGLG